MQMATPSPRASIINTTYTLVRRRVGRHRAGGNTVTEDTHVPVQTGRAVGTMLRPPEKAPRPPPPARLSAQQFVTTLPSAHWFMGFTPRGRFIPFFIPASVFLFSVNMSTSEIVPRLVFGVWALHYI